MSGGRPVRGLPVCTADVHVRRPSYHLFLLGNKKKTLILQRRLDALCPSCVSRRRHLGCPEIRFFFLWQLKKKRIVGCHFSRVAATSFRKGGSTYSPPLSSDRESFLFFFGCGSGLIFFLIGLGDDMPTAQQVARPKGRALLYTPTSLALPCGLCCTYKKAACAICPRTRRAAPHTRKRKKE